MQFGMFQSQQKFAAMEREKLRTEAFEPNTSATKQKQPPKKNIFWDSLD